MGILTIIFRENIYEDDEPLEVLDRFNRRIRVHTMDIYSVVLELTKQELIQKTLNHSIFVE